MTRPGLGARAARAGAVGPIRTPAVGFDDDDATTIPLRASRRIGLPSSADAPPLAISPELLAAAGRPLPSSAPPSAAALALAAARRAARLDRTGKAGPFFFRRRGTEWGGPWDWLSGPWFEPSRVSPVHPEWDDPTGQRIKRSLYASLGAHLLLAPLLFLIGTVRLPHLDTVPKTRTMTVTFSAPKGNSLTGPRTPAPPTPRAVAATAPGPTAPVAPPVKPPTPPPVKKSADAPPVTAKAQTPPPAPADTRARAADGHRVRETADPKESLVEAAKEKGNAKAGQGTTRVTAPKGTAKATEPPAPAKAEELPATQPVAAAGPLVASVAGPVAGSEVSLGDLDGVDFPHSYYLEQIRDKIAGAWNPPVGLKKGRRVEATIRFRILRDGQIVEQVIEVPSGVPVFDQAALRSVVDARKFGPLPDAFPGEFLVVHFQFTYTGP